MLAEQSTMPEAIYGSAPCAVHKIVTSVVDNRTEGWKSHVLPPGDYRLIGWDVDTTGRRLIDEICQIAAYTPAATFSQYVMPFQEMNPAARRRHNIRVVTIGRFRMLKDSKTNKILKTKSEVSALTDFVKWLEMIKGKSGDGVILVSYESRKVAAPLLLEALRKYNMLETFSSVVKGFANGYNVAEVKCAKTVRSFSLRTLSRELLGKEEEFDRAVDRARLSFEIVQRLCGVEEIQGCGDGSESASPGLVQAISEFILTISQEEDELAKIKTVLERQNTLRPVFTPMLRREKHRAMHLRKILADSGIDYELLTNAHKLKGKDGINELFTLKLVRVKARDIDDLKTVVQEHFEEEKEGSKGKPLPKENIVPSAENPGSEQTLSDEIVPVTTTASDTSSTAPVSESAPPSQDGQKTSEKESNEISSESAENSLPLTTSPASPAGTTQVPSQEPEEKPSSPGGGDAS